MTQKAKIKDEEDIGTEPKKTEQKEIPVNEFIKRVTPAPWFRKTVVLASVGIFVIALAGLTGYVPGLQVLGSIRMNYIPMAPSTAVCFFILSAVLFFYGQKPRQDFGLLSIMLLPLFVMGFGLLEVIGSLGGIDLTLEDRLISGAGTVGGIPIGRMSPATGVVFLVAALGIFLVLWSSNSRHAKRLGEWASVLGTLTFLLGATVVLGYTYGTPFLYGSTIIPMAATTAIAFVLLGIALVAAAGPESFPMSQLTGDATSARLLRVFLPLMAVMFIVQSALSRLMSALSTGNDALLLAFMVIVMGTVMVFLANRVTHFMGFNLDELKRDIQESEERYRALYFNSKDAIMVLTPEEGFIAGNPAAVKLFGCRDEKDFISRSPADLSPKYQLDGALSTVKAQEMMAQAVKSGSNFFAWTHMRVSGENFPATVLLSRLEINGKMVLQATIRDLTEGKKTEEAVKESQLMLQNIIDLLPTRIFWKDTNLNYLGGNKAFIQDAGKKSPAEILGKDDFDMGWKELADRYRTDDMAVITSGISRLDYEEPLITPAGDEIWVNTNKVPLKDNTGKIKGILGTYMDITHRKKAEKELQESEQKYIALIDAAPLCIKLFDAQGNIVSVNKYGREEHLLVGKNDEEIKKWKYIECIEPAYRTLVAQKMKQATEGKRAEFEFEHVPGTTAIGHWCYSYLEPIAERSGKVNYVLFISRDITAEKKNKEDVQKNIAQLTKLNEVMIGRELVMIKLKKELQVLRDSQNGEPVKNSK